MPTRLPDNVRPLTGTKPRPARNYPRFAPTRPVQPDFLAILGDRRAAQDARREWSRAIGPLAEQGVLASVDVFIGEDLCICAARIRQCEREVAAAGIMVEAAGRPDRGMVRHPLLVALNQYRAAYGRLSRQLGIGPASRQALSMPERDPGHLDPAERTTLEAKARSLGLSIDFDDPDWDLDLSPEASESLGY